MYRVYFKVHDINNSTELTPAEVLEAAWLSADEYLFFNSLHNEDSIITNAVITSGTLTGKTYNYIMLVVANDCVNCSDKVKKDLETWLNTLVGIDIKDFKIDNIIYTPNNKYETFTDECDIFKE